jgi:hypothetical protein
VAGTNWQEALARMPLPGGTNPVERENVVPRVLQGFQPNALVKAIVVLPGVSDDLYLINRDKPRLSLRASDLAEAITALTNASEIRATFTAPFLFLHRSEDFLVPQFIAKNARAVGRLQSETNLPQALFLDLHWKKLRPILNKALRPDVLPWSTSEASWHFARHNLAGRNLSDWELLTAVSLSGKTSFTVEKRRVTFRRRTGL